MSVAETRRKKIMALLQKHQSMAVSKIISQFSYSPATIRNDLKVLCNRGLIVRRHGFAAINSSTVQASNENFSDRTMKFHDEKVKLAHAAMKYIQSSECILLDASSTCYEIAKVLNKEPLRLTVITNGLMAANLLKANSLITPILIGGIVNGTSSAVEGLLGLNLLTKLNIDYAFLSPEAFTLDKGLTDFSIYEVQLKQQMVKYSNKKIALISPDKLGHNSLATFSEADQIDQFIIAQTPQNATQITSIFQDHPDLHYIVV